MITDIFSVDFWFVDYDTDGDGLKEITVNWPLPYLPNIGDCIAASNFIDESEHKRFEEIIQEDFFFVIGRTWGMDRDDNIFLRIDLSKEKD